MRLFQDKKKGARAPLFLQADYSNQRQELLPVAFTELVNLLRSLQNVLFAGVKWV